MISRSLLNIERAVDSLKQYHAHKPVRKGQLRDRQAQIGSLFYRVRESERASDDKAHVARARADLFKLFGKLGRGQLLALNTHRDNVGARRDQREYVYFVWCVNCQIALMKQIY